ncbi:MAG: hypothetical protein MUO82_12195 [Candidatus Thermoplasmatota archaeon]|nr:hypothetical protein [Candidatus Thermoplasmatota archaeon]
MVEKRDDKEEKNKIYRYSGIGFAKQVQKLKKSYIQEHEDLTGKIQDGLKIHLEFHYLLNTDIDWIVKLVRESMLEVIQEHLDSKNYYEKNRKRTILTFNIEQVSTEKSFDFLFTPGVIDEFIKEILLPIGTGLSATFIYETYKKFKNKHLNLYGRDNLKKIKCSRTKFIRHPDGTIEYIEEKDEFYFE